MGRRRWVRLTGVGLIWTLLVLAFLGVFSWTAHADNHEEEADNYSLYQLASNGSTFTSEKNSPEEDEPGLPGQWHPVSQSPAAGGSLLAYADPEFSVSNAVGWLFAEVSGSSQTLGYDALLPPAGSDIDASAYRGLLDYAYFGAANADLGLDSMSSGIMGGIMNAIGGSIVWLLYCLAILVGYLFVLVIKMLQIINPFLWFGEAVSAISPTFGKGMTQGQNVPEPLQPLSDFVSQWYGLLNAIAWEALVPIFLGVLLISLVLFKNMNRGSAIKKFVVRVVFIGLGLPLIGSMYTQVLNEFDETPSTSGPTQVVISTYVDFEMWMMADRLRIPDQAHTGDMSAISWDPEAGHAFARSANSARNTAAWINKQSYPGVYDDITPGSVTPDASLAYEANAQIASGGSDADAVSTTLGILERFIKGDQVSASDFESGIKSEITELDLSSETKQDWFVNEDTYGDVEDFGPEDGSPQPVNHPVLSVADPRNTGLVSQLISTDNPGHQTPRGFRSVNVGSGHCGYQVTRGGSADPAACNLSPLSAYNYLNAKFDPHAMTFYSSNKATSGFTRENHMSVSQVGTGPAKFMYWLNAVVLLGCIVVLGLSYAIFGLLATSIKRTFGVLAAVPFATLGAMAAISKVVIYSIAMILEIIVMLFLYQFVSQFLISVPNLLVQPMQALVGSDSMLGNTILAPVIVVGLTFLSCLILIGVTFMLLRVRKSVIQAIDEAVTKLIDKFLETNTVPPSGGTPNGPKGGALPALASGIGAGAAMAAGNKFAGGRNQLGGPDSKKTLGGGPTNAGGINGPKDGDPGGHGPDAPDGPNGHGGAGGPGARPGEPGKRAGELAGARVGSGSDRQHGDAGTDGGGSIAPSSSDGGVGAARTSQSDKALAGSVAQQGGLSNLGVAGRDGRVIPGSAAPSRAERRRAAVANAAQGALIAKSSGGAALTGAVAGAVAGRSGQQVGTARNGAIIAAASGGDAARGAMAGEAVGRAHRADAQRGPAASASAPRGSQAAATTSARVPTAQGVQSPGQSQQDMRSHPAPAAQAAAPPVQATPRQAAPPAGQPQRPQQAGAQTVPPAPVAPVAPASAPVQQVHAPVRPAQQATGAAGAPRAGAPAAQPQPPAAQRPVAQGAPGAQAPQVQRNVTQAPRSGTGPAPRAGTPATVSQAPQDGFGQPRAAAHMAPRQRPGSGSAGLGRHGPRIDPSSQVRKSKKRVEPEPRKDQGGDR